MFRAIHSIKGGGGAFGFSELVAFAHAYETLLDHVRDGRIELSEPVTTLCIRANDIVADFVNAAKSGASLGPAYGADERKQFDALWADLVELMAEGVVTGRIDTVRPEHTPEAMGRPPRKDDHGGEVYVYRRHGQECLVCGAKVRTDVLVGRNLFWCPRCQPAFRSRAVG